MIQFLIHLFLMTMNILFMSMNHPMSLGLILFLQTLILAILSSIINPWYSYMLFLIFIGGLLVLFIYVISLASNEIFSINFKLLSLIYLMLMLILLYSFYLDFFFFSNFLNQDSQIFNINMKMNEFNFSLIKLYNFPTNFLSITMMLYLLFTLIASIKISCVSKGPLRQMFN
uniref:NADH-ubiquinone oxidoreductase chain 6 n=1 Tax=Paradyschiria parvula TaxID=2572155 RepID=A0A5B9RFL3_9MUSC|nr:NADH dehydrogenase subunit 6 [Paradyschiria parvula]QEG77641.1 NADH dehydrogenase subunit 6 [Paradyschiria parvula]